VDWACEDCSSSLLLLQTTVEKHGENRGQQKNKHRGRVFGTRWRDTEGAGVPVFQDGKMIEPTKSREPVLGHGENDISEREEHTPHKPTSDACRCGDERIPQAHVTSARSSKQSVCLALGG
ncbi:unnamed protein product, partial [Ectocarpus sp. 12 AP-2014]